MLCFGRSTSQPIGVSFKTLKLYFLPHSDNNVFIHSMKVYDKPTGGADKSLARPGRKQASVSVRMA